jgi:hypothetical protein
MYIYILKYVIKEINLLFSNVYRYFAISLRGKVRRRQFILVPCMSADFFAVMVLLNFYLHVLIHYYFTASFYLHPLDTDKRPFLRL